MIELYLVKEPYDMTYDHVLVERRGAVGIVTLNRPDKLNAIHLAGARPARFGGRAGRRREAVKLGTEYAANPRGSVRYCKQLLYQNALEREMTLVLRREGDAQQALAGTLEMLEALAALKAKRLPDFVAARASTG